MGQSSAVAMRRASTFSPRPSACAVEENPPPPVLVPPVPPLPLVPVSPPPLVLVSPPPPVLVLPVPPLPLVPVSPPPPPEHPAIEAIAPTPASLSNARLSIETSRDIQPFHTFEGGKKIGTTLAIVVDLWLYTAIRKIRQVE
ncbi:hypothetical protein BRC80_06905 [Halobacteriales archaeon QH_9_66_26]|nr:MAG: hypothetical protein BRC80_06905 [Halobacteriales archaeon QH_9_66_26]